MSGAPWSVKGIDPKAREVAKDLARRSGMTLGEWLNHVILEDDLPEDASSEEQMGERPTRALDDMGAVARLRLVSSSPQGRADDMSRVAYALDRLTDRIEASETRTGLAINGVEHSVRQAVARIDAAERQSHAAAAQAEAVQSEQAMLAERLRQMDTDPAGPRSPEALRVLDQSVVRLSSNVEDYETRGRELMADMGRRLADAETHTAEALEALRVSLSALDLRMRRTEDGADPRFEALAATLAQKVEEARAEVARTLSATADGRVDQRLSELTARIETSERRSTQAIDRMGREVLSMAEILNRRVQDSETRSAQAIARVGEEMARIAGAVEDRMAQSDQVQAEVLEKLGGEIGRMTERMLLSERRAAQAIDDVGEQVSRVTERIEQRYDRAADDLAERIRLSEERAAGMLDEARRKFEQRFGVAGSVPETAPEPEPEVTSERPPEYVSIFDPEPEPAFTPFAAIAEEVHAEAEPVFAPSPLRAAPPVAVFGPELFSRVEADDRDLEDEAETPASDPEPFFQTSSPFAAGQAFAPIPEPLDDILNLAAPPPPEPMSATPSAHLHPLSTRDVIDQARAAARAAGPGDRMNRVQPSPREAPRPQARPQARPLPREPIGGLFGSGRGGRASSGSTLQTALLVAGGAAFLSVGAAGIVLMEGPVQIPERPPVAARIPVSQPVMPAPTPTPVPEAMPALPVAEAPPVQAPPPTPVAPPAKAPPRAAAPVTAAAPPKVAQAPAAGSAQYAQVIAGVEAQRPGALAQLRTIAEAGDARAQAYLGQLYENGRLGVQQNMTEARRWTSRAASRGDATSMHNLALYLFRGEGGPQDLPEAAKWFRQASERGVVNSQYNLGLLYQSGSGVGRDLAEAYKWFLIAADGGDAQARSNAVDLESKLTPQQLGAGERAADAFRGSKPKAPLQATPSSAPAAASPASNARVMSAQKALNRLGYYKGAQDGAASPAFKVAVSGYQRDQGLPASGVLDTNTAARLSTFAR
jgi:localization factor PodJL